MSIERARRLLENAHGDSWEERWLANTLKAVLTFAVESGMVKPGDDLVDVVEVLNG